MILNSFRVLLFPLSGSRLFQICEEQSSTKNQKTHEGASITTKATYIKFQKSHYMNRSSHIHYFQEYIILQETMVCCQPTIYELIDIHILKSNKITPP